MEDLYAGAGALKAHEIVGAASDVVEVELADHCGLRYFVPRNHEAVQIGVLFLSVVRGELRRHRKGESPFDAADQFGVEQSEVELQRQFVEDCEGADGPQLQHVGRSLQRQDNHSVGLCGEKVEVDVVVGDTVRVRYKDELVLSDDDFADVVDFPRVRHRNNEEFIVGCKLGSSVLIVAD